MRKNTYFNGFPAGVLHYNFSALESYSFPSLYLLSLCLLISVPVLRASLKLFL